MTVQLYCQLHSWTYTAGYINVYMFYRNVGLHGGFNYARLFYVYEKPLNGNKDKFYLSYR